MFGMLQHILSIKVQEFSVTLVGLVIKGQKNERKYIYKPLSS